MIYRIIIGVLLGAVFGGLVGYAGKCAGGGCPLTCNPVGGIITGAIVGFLIVSSSGNISTSGAGRSGDVTGKSQNSVVEDKVQK